MSLSITENFYKYFTIRFANTKELRQAAYKIRHNVYSNELGWEPTNKSEMEIDEYDYTSYHCILEHRTTKICAGCIRLIIPPIDNIKFKLPFEKMSIQSTKLTDLNPDAFRRGSFGELSRLAVLKSFRQKGKEEKIPSDLKENKSQIATFNNDKRCFSHVTTGLYLAGFALASICNHVGIFAVMEPKLNRLLRRIGFASVQISDEMNYRGSRAIFFFFLENFHANMGKEILEFYQKIYHDIKLQLSLIPYINSADSDVINIR